MISSLSVALLMVSSLRLTACQEDRWAKLFSRFEMSSEKDVAEWRDRSPEHKKVLEVILKREHWIGALKTIEEKLGRFPDDLTVKIELSEWESSHPAVGHATGSKGSVKFNMRRLVEYQKKVDQLEKQRKDLEVEGKKMIFRVPPIKFERIIYHELTHVLQAGYEAPEWFNEGLASWVGDDSNYLYAFAVAKKIVGEIDAPLAEADDAYGRGMLFFRWLESKIGKDGMKAFAKATLLDRGAWKEGLEKATGLDWQNLKSQEKAWSAKKIEGYKP